MGDPQTSDLHALLDSDARGMGLQELQQWGEALGRALVRPCVVTLAGDLGTGKTTLARALCRGFGVVNGNAVTSPTFAIVQEYETGTGTVVHADLYRLRDDSELDAMGWDEIVDTADVLLVEWPDRSTRAWPAGTVHITLAYGSDESAGSPSRTVTVTAV